MTTQTPNLTNACFRYDGSKEAENVYAQCRIYLGHRPCDTYGEFGYYYYMDIKNKCIVRGLKPESKKELSPSDYLTLLTSNQPPMEKNLTEKDLVVGNRFECRETVSYMYYSKGRTYNCAIEGCLTNDEGNILKIESPEFLNIHFKLISQPKQEEKVILDFAVKRKDDAEFDYFISLLNRTTGLNFTGIAAYYGYKNNAPYNVSSQEPCWTKNIVSSLDGVKILLGQIIPTPESAQEEGVKGKNKSNLMFDDLNPNEDDELKQLFRNNSDCWTSLEGDDKDPDIQAMTENTFVSIVNQKTLSLQQEVEKLKEKQEKVLRLIAALPEFGYDAGDVIFTIEKILTK